MTLSVDLFWSFRSPYSYLALPKTMRMVQQYDLVVNARPVYPLAVRVPGFFKKANPNFPRYVFLDSIRVAQMEGIPFRFPQPDPIDQNMTTLEVAPEQPRIRRLTRLGAAAQEAGKGLAFINAVATMMWGSDVSGWDQGDHLARATERAGLDLDKLDQAITKDVDRYEKIIDDNEGSTRRLQSLGRAVLRLQGRTLLRAGPHRPAGLAPQAERPARTRLSRLTQASRVKSARYARPHERRPFCTNYHAALRRFRRGRRCAPSRGRCVQNPVATARRPAAAARNFAA